jgi:phosphoribosylamine--glycine ligase
VRVLVIGSGGREHAIVRALSLDPAVTELHAAPGNPGIAGLAQLHEVKPNDPGDVTALARRLGADLVVIGPEAPLVAGVADALRDAGLAVFGPDAAAARIEGSKAYSKEVMGAAGIPTAAARTVSSHAEADEALALFGPPYVVKDDALAAGKGVVVTTDLAVARKHAAACGKVVIEEYLDGPEVSLFALCDGTAAIPLLAAQDFKRAHDGGQGPNTGGMGAYTPVAWAPEDLAAEVMTTVVQPAVNELRRRGTPYQGLLYAGLALTANGVRVVEFNARFGDPETQVILDRLATPLAGLLQASATGALASAPPLRWHRGAAVTVVLAAEGYPENPVKGDEIQLPSTERQGSYLLHAGTARTGGGRLVSAGGRVLNAVGTGRDVAAARSAAYEIAEQVTMRGGWYRRDIARLSRSPPGRLGTPHSLVARRSCLAPRSSAEALWRAGWRAAEDGTIPLRHDREVHAARNGARLERGPQVRALVQDRNACAGGARRGGHRTRGSGRAGSPGTRTHARGGRRGRGRYRS